MKQTIILDVSSDEEVGFDDSSTADNFDWISKLLEEDPSGDDASHRKDVLTNGGDSLDDDSDDVVVVGEVLPKLKRAKSTLPIYHRESFDDDDDCVVLTRDPDKPASAPTEGEDKGSEDDSDDLLIVGDKGQVACRDYPHSRHLCAKFPFGSTPHESHCDLCHCYVCDSLAPCAYWSSGVSDLDHCHATDKLEFWQLERKKIRQLKNPPAPLAKPAADSVSRLPELQQTSAHPTPVLTPASTCGVSSSFGLPNIISQARSQRACIATPRSRFQPHKGVRQFLRACNSTTQSHRNLGFPSPVSSPSLFKRSGFTGRPGLVNRSAYVPPVNSSVSYWQQLLNHPLVGKPAENNSINLTESSPDLDVNISSSQPLASSISTGPLPAHMQGWSNPVAQTPTSHFQGYGQSTVVAGDSHWVYSCGSHSQNDSSVHCNTSSAPNNVTASCQQCSAVTQNVSGPNFSRNTSNLLSSITPMNHQPSEGTQNFSSSSGFPYNTTNSMNAIEQNHEHHSVRNAQGQGAFPGHELLPSIEHNQQISGSMSSGSLDFDLGGWLENDPDLGVQDGSDLFNMNNHPSVPASVDAGMLYFDFETSWKGLAR